MQGVGQGATKDGGGDKGGTEEGGESDTAKEAAPCRASGRTDWDAPRRASGGEEGETLRRAPSRTQGWRRQSVKGDVASWPPAV